MTGFEIALLLGLLGSAGAATAGTLYTNKANQALNAKRWSESIELANTAHQREVADLRAAGLNPILSTGTAGAAVPSMASAEIANPLEGVGNLGKTAANMLNNTALAKSQKALYNAQADLATKNNELIGAKMGALKGDIAISDVKESLANEPEVKNAMRDEMLLRGAPKNSIEAGYLGYRKGKDEFGKYLDEKYGKEKSFGEKFRDFWKNVDKQQQEEWEEFKKRKGWR